MPRVSFLIPASPNAAFFSQVAAFSAALVRLPWTRWEPDVSVCFGGPVDHTAFAHWRPWLEDVACTFVPERVVARSSHWYGQIDALYRWAPRDADVLVRMDADTLPLGPLEDVLEHVLQTESIAGVMAHYRFPCPAGTTARETWIDVARGLVDAPLDFRLAYSLVGHEDAPGDRVAPFYPNDGVVFFPRARFDAFAERYLAIRPQLMGRLVNAYFSGQVALTLACTAIGARTCALPMRYNFPNDELAARCFPEELEDARIVHYLRTETFDRTRIFASAAGYDEFVRMPMEGANAVFRDKAVALLGAAYPFAEPGAGG